MAAVTSTSALKRGRPQIITAWAPKTYHRIPRASSTSARAWSNSATAPRSDTSEHLRDLLVSGKILVALLGCRPAVRERAKGIAEAQSVGRRHGRLLLRPVPFLRFRN